MAPSLDLRAFLVRARVLRLYRKALRTVLRAPPHARVELRRTVREEMENNRNCDDKQKVQFLISEGLQRIKQLDEMLDMQEYKSDSFAMDSKPDSKDLILTAVDTAFVATSTKRKKKTPPDKSDHKKRRQITTVGKHFIKSILTDESQHDYFRLQFRMYPAAFKNLCQVLKSKGLLQNTRDICIEEQLAMFLLQLGHCQRYKVMVEKFDRSTWTVSTYFNRVLEATLKLANQYVRPPSTKTHQKISTDAKYFPYFENCIGVIDGTHVPVHLVGPERVKYLNKKSEMTQNVMAVCNWDMEFIFVLAGKEGSVPDARILKSALEVKAGNFVVPSGKYFLVDAGYANMPGFLAPYQQVRWELKDFDRDHPPQNPVELFNYRHASLWSTMRSAIGELRSRFPVLNDKTAFPYSTQVKLVSVCCVLHNYIKLTESSDRWSETAVIGDVTDIIDDEEELACLSNFSEEQINAWLIFRDDVAQRMWEDVHTGKCPLW